MKRTDALSILKDKLRMLMSIDPSINEEAELVLSTLESIGMQPPSRIRYIDQDNGNTLCSEENSWEEEDK